MGLCRGTRVEWGARGALHRPWRPLTRPHMHSRLPAAPCCRSWWWMTTPCASRSSPRCCSAAGTRVRARAAAWPTSAPAPTGSPLFFRPCPDCPVTSRRVSPLQSRRAPTGATPWSCCASARRRTVTMTRISTTTTRRARRAAAAVVAAAAAGGASSSWCCRTSTCLTWTASACWSRSGWRWACQSSVSARPPLRGCSSPRFRSAAPSPFEAAALHACQLGHPSLPPPPRTLTSHTLPLITQRTHCAAAAVMSSNGDTNVVLRGVTHGAVDFLITPVRGAVRAGAGGGGGVQG